PAAGENQSINQGKRCPPCRANDAISPTHGLGTPTNMRGRARAAVTWFDSQRGSPRLLWLAATERRSTSIVPARSRDCSATSGFACLLHRRLGIIKFVGGLPRRRFSPSFFNPDFVLNFTAPGRSTSRGRFD